ncbi:transketolase, beta subunit [Jonquetella anthropi DSM 22815]|uniref:Transketolase, beta subunit n=1 Tax=Jonquetella anthropi DSM 22815 TaxID=885272 RepID=H0UL34_9BACT|nr:transketolase [Jonquetella anthropi]EEX47956.1 transketolase, N-terminal subunit [Jonquetella anthropi E3_33 E1]EHM13393.1 transketolase, beta subunit [Jonquetella anthropi DSM 22815]
MTSSELERIASDVRGDVVRMTAGLPPARIASALSAVDLFVALYWGVLNVDPVHLGALDRDRLIMADDRLVPAYYAVLARRGFFGRQNLWSWGKLGSLLQGLPDDRHTPGIDGPGGASSLSLALAYGMLRGNVRPVKVFCLVKAEEFQVETFWKTCQALGGAEKTPKILTVTENSAPRRTADELAQIGWATREIDGHDFEAMGRAFSSSAQSEVLFCRCRSGKGVSFLEQPGRFSEKPMSQLDREQAIGELEKRPSPPEEEISWTF